jgi:hypothetical protein
MGFTLNSIGVPAPNRTYDGSMRGGSSQWLMTRLNPLVIKYPGVPIINLLHATL